MNVLEITLGQSIETIIGGTGAAVTGKIALPPTAKNNLASLLFLGLRPTDSPAPAPFYDQAHNCPDQGVSRS